MAWSSTKSMLFGIFKYFIKTVLVRAIICCWYIKHVFTKVATIICSSDKNNVFNDEVKTGIMKLCLQWYKFGAEQIWRQMRNTLTSSEFWDTLPAKLALINYKLLTLHCWTKISLSETIYQLKEPPTTLIFWQMCIFVLSYSSVTRSFPFVSVNKSVNCL